MSTPQIHSIGQEREDRNDGQSTMRTALMLGMALVATFLFTACGEAASDSSDPSGAPALNGRTFTGDDVTQNGENYPLVSGSVITLTFDSESVGGSAGCNHMSSAASWDAGTLALDGGLAMTEMGCEEPLMKQDTWLADFLSSSPTLALDGDVLTLTGAKGTVITLTEDASS